MKRWIIFAILVAAAVLRLYALTSVPPSASLDEASIGYNAYSIVKTGKDEYGTFLPMLLRAYDDWRPALYVYLTVPFVAVLGLVPVAVRLPSVVLSVLSVYVVYLLGKRIGKTYLSFRYLGEIAAGILAVSPWHIYISRLGHEANLGFTLTLLAVYFFLVSVMEKRGRDLVISGILFGLSVYGYQSEKVIAPLLILAGLACFANDLKKHVRTWILAGALCALVALPAITATVSPQGMVRFRGTTAFNTDFPEYAAAKAAYLTARAGGDRIGQALHSNAAVSLRIFAGNYIAHFAPIWLFTGSDREAFKAPGVGLINTWELLFILAGVVAVFRSRVPKPLAWFILSVVVVSPVPAAMTTQAPHAMRAYTMLIGLVLIEAMGVRYAWGMLGKRYRAAGIGIMGLAVLLGNMGFAYGYFVRFPREQSDSFSFAMHQAVAYAAAHGDAYRTVDFSHQGNLYQSYMFFLFYTGYDPTTYQREGGTVSGGYDRSHRFGKYAFGYLPEKPEGFTPDTLYFYNADAVPSGLTTLATFSNLDGKPAIVAATPVRSR